MKVVALTLSALFVGLVTAQGSASDVPECAKPCVIDNLPSSCNGDFICICNDQNFITTISCCVFNSCSQAEQTKALDYAKGVCKAANAQLPVSAGCSSTTAAAAATSTTAPNPAATFAAPGVGIAGALLGAAVLL